MDLMYRDSNFKKISVIKKPSYVCNSGLFGASLNTFQLVLDYKEGILNIGDFITYGTSELGGKILRRIPDTQKKIVTYEGLSFRGQMEKSIISPYGILSLSGTLYEIIKKLFDISQIGYIIEETNSLATANINFPVGCNLLKAVDLTLSVFGYKMIFKVDNNGVTIKFVPRQEEKFRSSQASVIIDESRMLPTALHVLGKVNGNPQGVTAYVQSDGSIGTEKHFYGMDAIEIWQESSDDCQSVQQLRDITSDKLRALRIVDNKSSIDVKIENADIGDIIRISIDELGIRSFQTVSEKILKIKNNIEEITFNIGG